MLSFPWKKDSLKPLLLAFALLSKAGIWNIDQKSIKIDVEKRWHRLTSL